MARSASSHKRSEWRQRLGRFAQSKSSVAEFCQREEVSVASFYQWRKKLAAALAEPEKPPRHVTAASFIPVEVIAASDLQVAFPNGTRLTVPARDHALVRVLVEALAQSTRDEGLEDGK